MDNMEHRCAVQTGPSEGNTHCQEVSYYDILYDNKCDVCNQPLAPLREVLAHIYIELQTER